MNKRSAIAVASGLTGALVSGVAGYSVRVGQSATPEAAAPRPPIVRHKTTTITIHKKPRPAAQITRAPAVQTLIVRRAPTVVHSAPPAPNPGPVVHHTGGSGHAPGGGEDGEHDERGEHEDGGDD